MIGCGYHGERSGFEKGWHQVKRKLEVLFNVCIVSILCEFLGCRKVMQKLHCPNNNQPIHPEPEQLPQVGEGAGQEMASIVLIPPLPQDPVQPPPSDPYRLKEEPGGLIVTLIFI